MNAKKRNTYPLQPYYPERHLSSYAVPARPPLAPLVLPPTTITLALNAGPTVYIAMAGSRTLNQTVPLILGFVQFFISVIATLVFAIVQSGRMFGDRVASKSRKYLASQTFTASYPSMTTKQWLCSVLLCSLVFGYKFTESHWFQTLLPTVDGCHGRNEGGGVRQVLR